MNLIMTEKAASVSAWFTALLALKRPRAGMKFSVLHELRAVPKTLFTLAALKRSFFRVYLILIKKKKKVRFLPKEFPTFETHIGLFSIGNLILSCRAGLVPI